MSNPDDSRGINLDPTLHDLKKEEKVFLKQLTGIQDDDELRDHILTVQREAYAVYPYPCIKGFRFLGLKIARVPIYKDVLALGKERKGAILLDLGCCFGNDPRKVAFDGFPSDQILASDIQPEFWDLGHKLFKSNPSSFPITFVPGDILDDYFVKTATPATSPEKGEPHPYPVIKDLNLATSLNPLLGKISVIHVAAFFHLFNEEKQITVARKLAGLLSPESGSIIFGTHAGSPVKGLKETELFGTVFESFCHTPESFKDLWEKQVFGEGEVVCKASNYHFGEDKWLMFWSVHRV